jgi:hypothetical protein
LTGKLAFYSPILKSTACVELVPKAADKFLKPSTQIKLMSF